VSSTRARLAAAMVGLAVITVLITTLGSVVTVDRTLERFGRKDLQLSALHTAAAAADLYARDRGFSRRSVAELARLEDIQGHTLVVRDAAGHALAGSSEQHAQERALAPILVGGRRVGMVSLAHLGGGYLRLRETTSTGGLTRELHTQLRGRNIVIGLIATLIGLAVAVVLAIVLSRPVQRLTDAAERIGAGDLDAPIDVRHASAELQQLGSTLERVCETLKLQEDIRRETLSDLAHELRTPMAGLRGRIEAVQDGLLPDVPAALAAMHGDVLRLGRLMTDFERLAEAQQPGLMLDKHRVDLAELATSRAGAFQEAFRSRGIGFLVDAEPVPVLGDAERLGQVIDNLLSNALRYTDDGGRVILRVLEDRGEAMIEVADTGIGIAEADLPRIFDRFWRGDKSRSRATGGSGLGLALVHELVRAHDGRVEVESIPERGSRFRIHLPTVGPGRLPVVQFEGHADPATGAPVCVARLQRDLARSDWRAVEVALLQRVRGGADALIVDLSPLLVLDPRGVTALRTVHALMTARDGRFMVVRPAGSAVDRELRGTATVATMPVAADVSGAMAAVAGRQAA
jgi:signal transduction histidine kinase